jgi:FK506-binding protein 14
MCPGEKRRLTIPSSLGYGQRGAGNIIPGGRQSTLMKFKLIYYITLILISGATLLFDVELVGISSS